MPLPGPCSPWEATGPCWQRATGPIWGQTDWATALEEKVCGFARSVGIQVTVTSRLRTCEEQCTLYNAGRTTAAPNTSQHEWGCAFDVVPISGFTAYGATKKMAIEWLVALSKYYGGYGLAESDHAHCEVFSNATWRAWLIAQGLYPLIPIPGSKPKR